MPNTTPQQTQTRCLTLCKRTSWKTQHRHLITTINIGLQQNRRTFTNYKKADWAQFIEDTESAFAQTTIPTNMHIENIIFTNIILMTGKHIIPKGKMQSNCRLLPDHIVCKATQQNNMRRASTCDPAIKLLNEEITSNIHKQHLWMEQQRISTHTQHFHNMQQQNNNYTQNIANCLNKQFTNTVRHVTHKPNRSINRATQELQQKNHYTHHHSGPRGNNKK